MSAAVAAVLFAAAITPGPNNFVVMDVAGGAHPMAVAAPIGGIVTGTLALVVGVWFGLDALLARWPAGDVVLRLAGAGLLVYLALRTALAGWSDDAASEARSRRRGHLFPVMMLLQLVNPKTWVLAVAVVTAHGDAPPLTLLAPVVTVPTACLLAWACAGRGLAPVLARPRVRKVFTALMGSALLAFALVVRARGM